MKISEAEMLKLRSQVIREIIDDLEPDLRGLQVNYKESVENERLAKGSAQIVEASIVKSARSFVETSPESGEVVSKFTSDFLSGYRRDVVSTTEIRSFEQGRLMIMSDMIKKLQKRCDGLDRTYNSVQKEIEKASNPTTPAEEPGGIRERPERTVVKKLARDHILLYEEDVDVDKTSQDS